MTCRPWPISILALSACGSTQPTKGNASVHPYSDTIKYNQVGYYPKASKIKVVPSLKKVEATLTDGEGRKVIELESSEPEFWPYSGEFVVKLDLSSVTTVGTYSLRVDDIEQTINFEISEAPYTAMHKEGLRAYYINRASTELLPSFAGDFARPMGHPDNKVLIHASAATDARPENTVISSPKGWYDAGDYNKYVVNAGFTMYNLLAAYEHFPNFYKHKSTPGKASKFCLILG